MIRAFFLMCIAFLGLALGAALPLTFVALAKATDSTAANDPLHILKPNDTGLAVYRVTGERDTLPDRLDSLDLDPRNFRKEDCLPEERVRIVVMGPCVDTVVVGPGTVVVYLDDPEEE